MAIWLKWDASGNTKEAVDAGDNANVGDNCFIPAGDKNGLWCPIPCVELFVVKFVKVWWNPANPVPASPCGGIVEAMLAAIALVGSNGSLFNGRLVWNPISYEFWECFDWPWRWAFLSRFRPSKDFTNFCPDKVNRSRSKDPYQSDNRTDGRAVVVKRGIPTHTFKIHALQISIFLNFLDLFNLNLCVEVSAVDNSLHLFHFA